MQEQPKVFWPDKSQFAADFTDRRSGRKTKNLPLAVDERKERRFDNSIHAAGKQDIRLGKANANFSDEELKRQCEAQAAKAAAAPQVLVPPAVPTVMPVRLTADVVAGVAAEFSGPPWDE